MSHICPRCGNGWAQTLDKDRPCQFLHIERTCPDCARAQAYRDDERADIAIEEELDELRRGGRAEP